MSHADLLRQLADPATAAALNAAAAAMDDRTRLLAVISGLEMTNSTLITDLAVARARIAELEAPPPATYTVVAGDTLLKIGRRYRIQALDIQAWNRLPDTTIRPGQVLRLTPPEPAPDPEAPAALTVLGVNKNRDAQLGRTPKHRDYYAPGEFEATNGVFDPKKFGKVTGEFAFSFKLHPRDVIAGRHDKLITDWLTSAAGKLPRLVPGRRHLGTVWHEPASEIKAGTFTAEQHGQANAHFARLILAAGLQGVFGVTLNYTISKSRATFNPDWVPQASIFPAGVLVVLSGDTYGNPYPSGGKTGLDTPYPDPGEDLEILWATAEAKGYAVWAIWEFNAPLRSHDDPQQSKRRAWLDGFVEYAMTRGPSVPYELLFWEGKGNLWPQFFGGDEMVAWARDFVARSPRTVAA